MLNSCEHTKKHEHHHPGSKELMERYKDSELVDDLIQRKTEQKMYQADENFPNREVNLTCCLDVVKQQHFICQHIINNKSHLDIPNHAARICVSTGYGPAARKRMLSAVWSRWALPRRELVLGRSLGTWCWNPRTSDLVSSQCLHLILVDSHCS